MKQAAAHSSKKKPRDMSTVFVRLLAIALLVGGWMGTQIMSVTRVHTTSISITLSTTNASELNAVFSEAMRGMQGAKIIRNTANIHVLDVGFEGSSWNEADEVQNRFANVVRKVVTARKLRITNSNSYSGSYYTRSSYRERFWFLSAVATTIFGAAMLILSLRIFGGGKRSAHAPAASSAA